MCEANVYLRKNGQDQLFMESVDLIIPSDDGTLFLENIFGERKVLKANILEMQLVHHSIIIAEPGSATIVKNRQELWLEPVTDHGHFHAGEEVLIKVLRGYNMKPNTSQTADGIQAYALSSAGKTAIPVSTIDGGLRLNLGLEADGLIQVYVQETIDQINYWGKIVLEIGHHHHHDLSALGLPLEIVPSDYAHARIGASYEVKVVKNGMPLENALVQVTHSGTKNPDYPFNLTSDAQGLVRLFLSAPGNYLFAVEDENIRSTYTLVKSF